MKKLFTFIQEHGFELALLFPALSIFLQVVEIAWGVMPFFILLSVLTVTSTMVTVFLFWYLLAKFQLKKRGYFTAVGFAATFTSVQGWGEVLYRLETISHTTHEGLITSAAILLFGILWGIFSEWFIKPLPGEVGGE